MNTAPAPARLASSERHILLVEDDDTQRTAYAGMARTAGHTVTAVPDADQAITYLDSNAQAVDLLLVDVDLGTSSGLTVLRWVRAHPGLTTVPVILLTGHDDVEARVAGLSAGASDYVGKPVHPRELQARIEAQLRATTSWNQVLAEDLQQRVLLAKAVSDAHSSRAPGQFRDAVETALGRLPGVARAAILTLGASLTPDDAAERSDVIAALLADAGHAGLAARVHNGPWMQRCAGGDVMVCAPLASESGPAALLVLQHDPRGQVAPERVLASALDASVVIAPLAVERLLGPRGLAATHDRITRLIERKDFQPVFQPIVDLRSASVVGHEGLTRFGNQRPDLVFADAERVGLARALQAATTAALVRAAGSLPSSAYLALNTSAAMIADEELAGLLPADRQVVVEITEHERVDDYQRVRRAMGRLGDHVRLAVDDAGAGYASLQHILSLRPAIIKLDRSLIADLHRQPGQEAMIAGLVHFSRRSGARLVAEGIEDPREAAAARDLGVEFGQGFLFGRPAPPVDAHAALA